MPCISSGWPGGSRRKRAKSRHPPGTLHRSDGVEPCTGPRSDGYSRRTIYVAYARFDLAGGRSLPVPGSVEDRWVVAFSRLESTRSVKRIYHMWVMTC